MGVPFPALKTMVTVVLLLMGNASPVVLSPAIPLSTVRNFASGVVTRGSSLACHSLDDLVARGYKVTCSIQVENWTNFLLMAPKLRINGNGAATTSPTIIAPGKREAFAVRKPLGLTSGVEGTVSWEVPWLKRRFFLMWSVPFNTLHYSNTMGLGMTEEKISNVAPGRAWFNQMYYGNSNTSFTFIRKTYTSDTDSFIYRNDRFEIEGLMTNGRNAQIKVIFRPITDNWVDLADPIREKVDSLLEKPLLCDK